MKKNILILTVFMTLFANAQETPKVLKKAFSKVALEQKVTTTDAKKISILDILAKHKGEIIVLDFWASWCKDCINAMPEAEKLKENNPKIVFIYLSLDRNLGAWMTGIEKHHLSKSENYWFDAGWKNQFNDYVDLNWIPRYMVIDQKGKIAKYYAVLPQDPEIQKTIDILSK